MNSPVSIGLGKKLDAAVYAAGTGTLARFPFSEIVALADEADADPEETARALHRNQLDGIDVRQSLYDSYFGELAGAEVSMASIVGDDAVARRARDKAQEMSKFLGVDTEVVEGARSLRQVGDPVPYDLMKSEFYSR